MWNLNLNRHFAKFLAVLKIPLFLLIWNGILHALTLSILVYWSLTSTRVPELNRMSTMNQFWAENQILFATLSCVAISFFFQDRLLKLWRERNLAAFSVNFLRGALLAVVLVAGLVISKKFEFLGFSAQLNLNFLTSYAWVLRAILVFLFVLSTEFLIRIVLREELQREVSTRVRFAIETFCFVALYWIWFSPTLTEVFSLLMLYTLFLNFWSSSGFLSALFVFTHAVFGLPFFENEFVGILQVKSSRFEEHFLQNPQLVLVLMILWGTFRGSKIFMIYFRKSERNAHS
jgi:hypothetical protein